jgi:hypothetical protein
MRSLAAHELLDRTQEVAGSSPASSIFFRFAGILSLSCDPAPAVRCVGRGSEGCDLRGFCYWSDRLVGFQAVIGRRRA